MKVNNDKTTVSFLERLKNKAQSQTMYGCADFKMEDAQMDVRDCPNCGAGRAQRDGLTHCAYCGFEFMSVTLDKGIHINNNKNN